MSSKYKIQFTVPALNDLEKIKYYLDGYSPYLFYSFRKQFIDKINLLETQPKLYKVISLETSVQYRRFFVNNYAVIYDVDDEKKLIIIDRIYHCKEDYLNNVYQYK